MPSLYIPHFDNRMYAEYTLFFFEKRYSQPDRYTPDNWLSALRIQYIHFFSRRKALLSKHCCAESIVCSALQ